MSSLESRAPIVRAIRFVRLAWARRRRRRERACVRCGARAAGMCPACGGRICAACAVVSIETGSPVAICISCSGTTESTSAPRARPRPWHLFRTGAGILLLVIAAAAAVALERDGWPGAVRVVLTVLHPSMLLGLVPLALVVGALASLVQRLVRGRLG